MVRTQATQGTVRSEFQPLRRYGWCIALAGVAAGLAGFVFAGRTDRGYSATAYIEVVAAGADGAASTAHVAQPEAIGELLESAEVRTAVAAELGTNSARIRPIVAFVPAEPGLIGARVAGHNPRRVRKIAEVAVAVAADLHRQRTGVQPEVLTGEVRQGGLSPVRTTLAATVGGLVLAACVAYVVAYCRSGVASGEERHAARVPVTFGARSPGPVDPAVRTAR